MHADLREAIIASVRRRFEQGDCPTEPAHTVETLEHVILDLSSKPPAGGDAVPEYAPDDISHLEGLASYLDGYARDKGRAGLPASKSLFEEIAKRLREYDAMRTPKPPAGGDAGAVEREKIREALTPFAQWADWYEGMALTDEAVAHGMGRINAPPSYILVGDLRRARAILAALPLPAPVVEGALPDDERGALDKALERFASAVPYGNEPEAVGVPAPVELDPESAPGRVGWHTSEEGGGPDVGISVGLGFGSSLFIGDLLDRDGGPVGIVFHGPGGVRHAARLSELDEVRDLFEHHVAPAIAALSEGRSHG